MSTIIMLPTPPAMRASASGAAKTSGGAGDFAAVLGQADAEAAGTGGAGGPAGDAALVTVADLVQAAAGLLGTVGGAQDETADGELPTEGSDGATDETTDETADGAAGVVPAEEADGEAVLAQVVDLARWRGGERPAGSAAGGQTPAAATGPGQGASGTAAPSPTGTPAAAGPIADAAAVEAAADDASAPRPAATLAAVPEAATAVPGAATPAATGAPSAAPATASASAVTVMPVAGAEHAVVATAPSSSTPEVEAPAPTAPATPSAPTKPLTEQLGVRLGALRDAGPGQHVLTLRVDPESYGPVRVVAHIGAEGVRIELLGATDQAREALRAALPDLRRDLVAAGLQADLELGSSSNRQQAGAGTELGADGRRAAADRSAGSGDGTRGRGTDGADPETTDPTDPEPRLGAGRIDLLV